MSILSTVSLVLGGGLIAFAVLYTFGNVTALARSNQPPPLQIAIFDCYRTDLIQYANLVGVKKQLQVY